MRGSGPPSRRNQDEHAQQRAFFDWLRLHEGRHPILKRFYAIPNGRRRDHGEAIKLWLEGVRRGVLDTHLPLPRHGKTGLWIEFKAGNNQLTADQIEWKAALEREGHVVYVVRDWVEAAELTVAYLDLEGVALPAGNRLDQQNRINRRINAG